MDTCRSVRVLRLHDFYRWEWIVVGIALLLLIYPFILSFVYFRYGLSPESRREIQPRRVIFDDEGITVEILKAHTDDQGQTTYTDDAKARINYSQVRDVNQSSEGVTLRLKTPRYAHVFVPSTAFENQTDIETVRNLLADKVKMA